MALQINKQDITFKQTENYPLLNKAYGFYQKTDLHISSNYDEYEQEAKAMLSAWSMVDKNNYEKELKKFHETENNDVIQENTFLFNENFSDEDKYGLAISFQNFCLTIRNVLTGYYPRSLKDEGAVVNYNTQSSPKNASYHLLFE